MLDLSALEGSTTKQTPGELPRMRLDLIEEDPYQPRKEFDEDAMVDITASIKANGVIQPIEIRPHPDKPGCWIIVHGARRYRGALRAALDEIPYYIGNGGNERQRLYIQVLENLQRDNLKPMELGEAIAKLIEEGESKADVAKGLGKDASFITHHLSLVDSPACIKQLYASGKCTSPKTLYDLRKLHDKNPSVVEGWCERVEKLDLTVDRYAVTKLSEEIAFVERQGHALAPSDSAASAQAAVETDHTEPEPAQIKEGQKEKPAGKKTTTQEATNPQDLAQEETDLPPLDPTPIVSHIPYHNPGNEHGERPPKPPANGAIKKPLLLVELNRRAAMLLLHRLPTSPGLVHVRFEDTGEDEEVEAGLLKITMLCQAIK